jgi:Peptidase family M23
MMNRQISRMMVDLPGISYSKEGGDQGGWNKKYRPYGNNIVIQHPDGTRAGYWHLQHNGAWVSVGDTVRKGQAIGLSGKTGYAALPPIGRYPLFLNKLIFVLPGNIPAIYNGYSSNHLV